MSRYFIEVSYKGTLYHGFQKQPNGNSIQQEVEKAFATFFNQSLLINNNWELTGSSRTDAGVHALQNFFHFDWPGSFDPKWIYNLNAILPKDIVINSVQRVGDQGHCRFDALSRTYHYRIYSYKNAFLKDTAYFYPYPLNIEKLNEAADIVKGYTDFTSFSKRNTQVHNFRCNIMESSWQQEGELLIYKVKANRFLRGMVRAITATMLKVGREKISLTELRQIIEAKDCTKAFFDTPAHGLFLVKVDF